MEGCLPLFPAIDWLSLFRMAAARLFAPKEDAKPVETVSISQQAAQILDTYGDTILRYAYSYLHNRSDTEEVLQDTLIQFLKTRPVFESDEHEKAWLLRVAGNLCKNRLKYNSLRQTDELREELIAEQREDLSFIWTLCRHCRCSTGRLSTFFTGRATPPGRSVKFWGEKRQRSALTSVVGAVS